MHPFESEFMDIKQLCCLAWIRYILKDDITVLLQNISMYVTLSFTQLCCFHFLHLASFSRKSCLLQLKSFKFSLFFSSMTRTDVLCGADFSLHLHLYQFTRMGARGWARSIGLSGIQSPNSIKLTSIPGPGPSTGSTIGNWSSQGCPLLPVMGWQMQVLFTEYFLSLPQVVPREAVDRTLFRHAGGSVVSLLGKHFKPCLLLPATRRKCHDGICEPGSQYKEVPADLRWQCSLHEKEPSLIFSHWDFGLVCYCSEGGHGNPISVLLPERQTASVGCSP